MREGQTLSFPGSPALCGIGLENEESAFQAALTEPWSTGQVEGQTTRLKLLTRQMYGRANLDLLRVRMLHAA